MCYNHKTSGLLSHNDRNINNATKIKPNTTPEETQPETIHSFFESLNNDINASFSEKRDHSKSVWTGVH